jgi:hypothetical protein
MPSSSTTSTHLEKSLITHFRRIFIHLSLSARWEELDYLLDTFASTLDLSDHSLQLAFYPSSLSPGKSAILRLCGRKSRYWKT